MGEIWAISYRFPSGLYHAKAWGRDGNEGEVEWPPSPWSVLRALLATWLRKRRTIGWELGGKLQNEDEAGRVLRKVILDLAGTLPVYQLPRVSRSLICPHKPGAGALHRASPRCHAFVRINPEDELIMAWPDVSLEPDERRLLDALLRELENLGGNECRVEARLIQWEGRPNCYPAEQQMRYNHGARGMESVSLLAVKSEAEFVAWREGVLEGMKISQNVSRGRGHRRMPDLPETLCDALSADILDCDVEPRGWNRPPGSRRVVYLRPCDCFSGEPVVEVGPKSAGSFNIARFSLAGETLPSVLQAVDVGELFRRAILDILDSDAPPVITGRDENGQVLADGHRHAFFLPEDADLDGRIDHLVLYSADPFPESVVVGLRSLSKLWTAEREWLLFLEGVESGPAVFQSGTPFSSLLGPSRVWESATPYLHPWFQKRSGKFGREEQLRKEIRLRGLPEPVRVEWIPFVKAGTRPVTTLQFRRSRRGGTNLTQPDRWGGFYKLEFPQPVRGPLAFGYGCHFGLGLFVPARSASFQAGEG